MKRLIRRAAGVVEGLPSDAPSLYGDATELLGDAGEAGAERPEEIVDTVVAERRGRAAAPETDVLTPLRRTNTLGFGRVQRPLTREKFLLTRSALVIVVERVLLPGTRGAAAALVPIPIVAAARRGVEAGAATGAAHAVRGPDVTGYRGCRCGAHGDIRGTGPWSALGGGGDFLLERLRRAGVVLHLRVRVLVDAVALQERVQVGVSASLHLLELDRGPGVHAHGSARGEERRKGFERRSAFGQSGHGRADELDENETRPGRVRRRGGSGNETRRSRGAMFGRAPDEADVDAESAVDPGTLEAHEDAVGHGCPLRVLGVAVGARLRRRRGRGLGAGEGGETRESARRTGNGGQKKRAVDGGARRARTSRAIASLVPMATRGAIGGVASERTHPVVALLLQLAKYRGSLGRRHCPGSFNRRLSAWCAVSDARACRRVCGAEVPSAPTSLVRPRGPRKGCERSKRINERIDPLSTVREPKRPDGPGSPRRRSRDSDRNLLSKVCTRHVWLSDASRHCERAEAYLAILCGARGEKALGEAS